MAYFDRLAKKAAEAAAVAQKAAVEATVVAQKAASKAAATAQKTAAEAAVVTQKTVVEASAVAQKAAAEAADTVQKVAGNAVKTVSSTGKAIGDSASSAKSSMRQWAEDFLGVITLKLKELVGQIDFEETIANVEKVGKEKKIGVTPMLNFIRLLQNFAEDGKRNS